MSINSHISELRDRVKDFLEINERVELLDLKLHLECKGTELLLAIGGLMKDGLVELEKDSWKIIVYKNSKFKNQNEK